MFYELSNIIENRSNLSDGEMVLLILCNVLFFRK